MKTKKRDKKERAYTQGYKAGIRGHSEDFCHLEDSNARGSWFGGWREGRSQFIAGYISEPPEHHSETQEE